MKSRVVLLSVAVVLALLGTAAVATYVAGADSRALSGTRAAEVVVASAAIPEGTSLESLRAQGMTATATFPMSTLPPDALTTLDGVEPGSVTTRDLAPREILLAGVLGVDATDRSSAAGLTLPPGTSAVPVSFASFTGAKDWSGWIGSGAEIAVYSTYTPRTPTGTVPIDEGVGVVTRLLLDRVTVLAVGSAPSTAEGSEEGSEEESGDAEGGTAFVLALTQQQSERLIMGLSRESKLYPVLLSPDSAVRPSPGTADTQLFDPLVPAPGTRTAPRDPATAATAPAPAAAPRSDG